ncbi:hypothetical protein GGF42_004193 [Coemansia sp. RSA 2424]|nr:hypothetical protein GGF42_004193 [Coemansia sp. RSA 2424]
MSEAPAAAFSAAVAAVAAAAAAEAASTAPGLSESVLASAIDPRLTAPFPQLEPDQPSLANITSEEITVATAAAFSNAIASAQLSGSSAEAMALASPSVPSSLSSAMAGVSVQSPTAASGGGDILASLQQNARDQVMEIMSSHHTNSHRRRSSVEAAAAASSVLASIANSTKSYMGGGDVAAAIAAAAVAANSPQSIGSYPGHPSQHSAATAALLAVSGMHSVVMPTIPSVSTSLQGTPAPGERMSLSAGTDDDAVAAAAALVDDATMQGFDVAALGGLSADVFSNTGQIATSLAPATVDLQDALQTPGLPRSAQNMTTPTKTPGRRRKATAGVSVATAAVAKGEQYYDSMSDDRDDDDDDEEMGRDRGGMPLTPDAPGSGRPGSLRHLTTDERRARRLQRNRLAAKECRQKKKAYINNLESQVCDLQEENSQLRKEIKELNAKLTLSGMRASSSVTTPTLEFKVPVPPERAAEVSASRQTSPVLAPSKRPRVAARSPSSNAMKDED